MIDKEKYSKKVFELVRDNPESMRVLIEELQKDVAKDFQSLIENHMRNIVRELNSVGHKLKENVPDSLDETDFCEFHNNEKEKSCGFRIGTFLSVCAGYYKIGEEYLYEE